MTTIACLLDEAGLRSPLSPFFAHARWLVRVDTASGQEVWLPQLSRQNGFRHSGLRRGSPGVDVEIDVAALRAKAAASHQLRGSVEEFMMPDGRRLRLLAEGRLVNLGAAEGHPAAVMDMSFANQLLVAERFAAQADQLASDVHRVPPEIDRQVACLKLAALGIVIDRLTEAQKIYLASWSEGTA